MRPLSTLLIALFMVCGLSLSAQKSHEVQVLLKKANTQMDAGKKQAAKATIEKAYKLAPKHIEVLALKGFIHYELDEYKLAIETYDKLIAIKESGEAYYYRGMAHLDLKETDKACADFTKAKELGYKLARIQHQQFCK